MIGAEFDERIHLVNKNARPVLRRYFDTKTGKVSETNAPPFVLNDKGEKIVNQKAFDDIWPKLRVIARCLPEDKLALVRGLRNSEVFGQPVCFFPSSFIFRFIKVLRNAGRART